MNSKTLILLDDKQIDNIPRNVLKAKEKTLKVKSRILNDNQEEEIKLNENLLNFVTEGLKFHRDVLKEQCAHALPYDENTLKDAYRNKHDLHVIAVKPTDEKPKPVVPRYLKSVYKHETEPEPVNTQALVPFKDFVNVPSKAAKFGIPQVFVPLDEYLDKKCILHKGETLMSIDLNSVRETMTSGASGSNDDTVNSDTERGIFLTEEQVQKQIDDKLSANYEATKQVWKPNWDDFVLNKLSENTAKWIVVKRTEDNQKKKLLEFLEKKYGKITKNLDDIQLIDEPEEVHIQNLNKQLQLDKVWKSSTEILLDPANKVDINPNDVPLYRLPRGIRQQMKNKEKEDSMYFNTTVQKAILDSRRVFSPDMFKDRIRKKLYGDKTVYLTNDPYQLELLEGTNREYTQNLDDIEFDNGKKFQKVTQSVYPEKFVQWINGDDSNKYKNAYKNTKRFRKGPRRWQNMPKAVEDEMEKPDTSEEVDEAFWYLLPAATPDHELKKLIKANTTLSYIVQEWRRKWQIGSRWACAEIDELIKDMKDIHANVRFQAVVVCSRAAEYANANPSCIIPEADESQDEANGTIAEEDEDEDGEKEAGEIKKKSKTYYNINTNDNKSLPEKLFVAIECLLNDSNDKVKLAAAITLFTVERTRSSPNAKDKAEAILRETLHSHNLADKYASAQCLASHGICEYQIILILIQNYFDSDEEVTREQVIKLIAELSRKTNLVNLMIGEYLNSDDIKCKIYACKLLPCLKRPLNRDITNKLVHLMWNDTSKHIRKVAAQTLGRTGRGQYVHDEIYQRLQSINVNDRIEALKKVNYLGIMTTKLLPPYLKCFSDEFITVREVACMAAQRLSYVDEKVVAKLIELAQFDEAPKIKACAIQTLGLISQPRDDLKRCLVWAVRFERNSIVRAEACNSLVLLYNKSDPDIIEILHDRYLIEADTLVKTQLYDALRLIDFDPTEDMPILSQIKSEVKRLNNKETIWAKISELEKELNFENERKRFIYMDKSRLSPSKMSMKSDATSLSIKDKGHYSSTPNKDTATKVIADVVQHNRIPNLKSTKSVSIEQDEDLHDDDDVAELTSASIDQIQNIVLKNKIEQNSNDKVESFLSRLVEDENGSNSDYIDPSELKQIEIDKELAKKLANKAKQKQLRHQHSLSNEVLIAAQVIYEEEP